MYYTFYSKDEVDSGTLETIPEPTSTSQGNKIIHSDNCMSLPLTCVAAQSLQPVLICLIYSIC